MKVTPEMIRAGTEEIDKVLRLYAGRADPPTADEVALWLGIKLAVLRGYASAGGQRLKPQRSVSPAKSRPDAITP